MARIQSAVRVLLLVVLRRLSGRRKRRFWQAFLGFLGAYSLAVGSSGTVLDFERLGSQSSDWRRVLEVGLGTGLPSSSKGSAQRL